MAAKLVGEDGFEPSKRYAADLQSVPFGHSGTPPYSVVLFDGCLLEPVDGLVQSRSGSVKPSPATLVRVAFNCSSLIELSLWLEPVDGLEPPTY